MVKFRYGFGASFHGSSKALLGEMIPIVEDYYGRGYTLTVRQLYYQLVSRNVVSNSLPSYKRVSNMLLKARMKGLVDWAAIKDRGRKRRMPGEYESMAEFVEAIKGAYRRCRWDGQKHYLEVMVEKEALAGVLEDVAVKYHVSLSANKGYTSASAMHDVAGRMRYQTNRGIKCHILYLGDHDPSGMDMVRDIKDRLSQFWAFPKVERIALNMDQIREHDLPPNPAKKTDPRSRKYAAKYGGDSWELDALDPAILEDMLEKAILRHLDVKAYMAVVKQEAEDTKRLEGIATGA